MAVLLVLCGAHAGPPVEPPASRCLLTAKPAWVKAVASTGLPELDARIASEKSFLETLFGVRPELVLMAEGAPRLAFVVAGPEGKGAVFVGAPWLRHVWSGPNRIAAVAALLAHQYAHVFQAKRKCTHLEWSREQHADFLAGWFLGKRNIAALKGGEDLDAAFAASLFAFHDEFLNAPFDHGSPPMRAEAMGRGFRLSREGKRRLDALYEEGLDLFPPAKEGILGGPKLHGLLARVKLGCLHEGPCQHQIPCQHREPCIHEIECEHKLSCDHRIPCVHKVDCEHRTSCTHIVTRERRVCCTHRVPCRHWSPCCHRVQCTHTLHDCDYEYRNGWAYSVPCTHFRHEVCYAHEFDYEHEWDLEHEYDLECVRQAEHEYDLEHEFDMAHDFDTEHPFHLAHEFDLAHAWDPVHSHDLAHEWDPLHDYDVMLVPETGAAGASGAE